MIKNEGFTTIELVTVIIIVAILAVNVLPKFDGTSSYQAHTHRAQLISALRLTQQRAMQQTDTANYCHQLILEADRYGIDNRIDCSKQDIYRTDWVPDLTGHIVEQGNNITFSIGGSSSKKIVSFDDLGKPRANSSCAGGCIITIDSPASTLTIIIESEGYIHAS